MLLLVSVANEMLCGNFSSRFVAHHLLELAQFRGHTIVHIGLHFDLRDELLEQCFLINARIAQHF